MRTGALVPLAMLVLVAAVGCTGNAPPSLGHGDPPSRSRLITNEDLRRSQSTWPNAYDLVDALRPGWLRPRGVGSLRGNPGGVQVLLDGVRVGGVTALRQVSSNSITAVEYYDPISAASRFGLGFGYGAIAISTLPIR